MVFLCSYLGVKVPYCTDCKRAFNMVDCIQYASGGLYTFMYTISSAREQCLTCQRLTCQRLTCGFETPCNPLYLCLTANSPLYSARLRCCLRLEVCRSRHWSRRVGLPFQCCLSECAESILYIFPSQSRYLHIMMLCVHLSMSGELLGLYTLNCALVLQINLVAD